ncbi:MAG: hypothetical protein JRN10_00820 [Nitrososphaerota archaeon]|jgi:hypothetical protein|nr:hypothetical protein [Nitrososphaerota archaeon]MDG6929779.1 hypothetical protein [Nitrososphaerota archaeon]
MNEDFEEEAADFLRYIRDDMESLKKEMNESIISVNSGLQMLLKEDIFEDETKFLDVINSVHMILHRYVKQQLTLETQKGNIQESAPQQPQEVRGWRERLASVLGSRKPAEQYERMTPSTNTIDMESQILRLRIQFPAHRELLKRYQQDEEWRGEILFHWREAVSHVFINILNYVRASYELEIDEYVRLRESLTKATLMQGSHMEPETTKK